MFARADQHAAAVGIAAGVAEEIAQNPCQQAEVRSDGEARNVVLQAKPGGSRHRLEFGNQRQQDIVQRVDVDVRFDGRLVELGDIEQVGQQILGALQRLVRTLDQMAFTLRQGTLAQRRDEQPRSVERLQQVVAGSSEILVLAEVGGLRRISRLAQFAGALGDATLQFLIELQQAQLGELALGDVSDEAFHQAVLVRFEQQVHHHVDGAAILAAQACLVTEQPVLLAQGVADLAQLVLAADEQMV